MMLLGVLGVIEYLVCGGGYLFGGVLQLFCVYSSSVWCCCVLLSVGDGCVVVVWIWFGVWVRVCSFCVVLLMM